MNIYIVISLCLLPAAIALLAVCLLNKLPPLMSLLPISLALVIVLPISAVETYALKMVNASPSRYAAASNLSGAAALAALLLSVFAVALVEEVSKSLALFALPIKRLTNGWSPSAADRRSPSSRRWRRIEGCIEGRFLLCAFLFGLSLGCFESVAYLLHILVRTSDMGASPVYSNIFQRIFTSDALHASCAVLDGIFILSLRIPKAVGDNSQTMPPLGDISRGGPRVAAAGGVSRGISNGGKKVKTQSMAIVCSILLHALYDFLAINTSRRYFCIAAILLAIVECRKYYRRVGNRE